MKLIKRKAFLQLPAGTLYSKDERPYIGFGSMQVKGSESGDVHWNNDEMFLVCDRADLIMLQQLINDELNRTVGDKGNRAAIIDRDRFILFKRNELMGLQQCIADALALTAPSDAEQQQADRITQVDKDNRSISFDKCLEAAHLKYNEDQKQHPCAPPLVNYVQLELMRTTESRSVPTLSDVESLRDWYIKQSDNFKENIKQAQRELKLIENQELRQDVFIQCLNKSRDQYDAALKAANNNFAIVDNIPIFIRRNLAIMSGLGNIPALNSVSALHDWYVKGVH